MVKQYFLILVIFILLFSCKKKEEQEYTDASGEIIFTDTFSPPDWENPGARNKLKPEDKNIGRIIEDDIMDPRIRKVLKLVESFINNIQLRNPDAIEKILTPSAFNTFNIRFPEIILPENFELRVAYPSSENNSSQITPQEENNPVLPTLSPVIDQKNNNQFFVEFKLIYQTHSIVSRLQIDQIGDDYKISDFENKFFDELKDLSKK